MQQQLDNYSIRHNLLNITLVIRISWLYESDADGVLRCADLTAFADIADRSETKMPYQTVLKKRISKILRILI